MSYLNYALMGFKESSYDQIPYTRLSADYVYRETKRALEGVAGKNTLIWAGIDIDIPTEPARRISTGFACTIPRLEESVLSARKPPEHSWEQ
jgi:hypothetical protein